MKYLIAIILGLILSNTGILSQYQSDSSDAVWSIVVPSASSNDIDMGKVLIGAYKDSVISSFVKNTGSWDCRINDIKLSGINASDFYVISNRTFTLKPGENKSIEFHFKPGAVGNRNAVIEIETQSDTLIHSIKGEGVQPQIQLLTKLVDFGIIEAGSIKDSLVYLLKNLSTDSIDVTDTKLLGPDLVQFEIINGGGAFTLLAGESRELTLRFKPNAIGRTSSELAFYHNNPGSPVRTQLYGQGIGGIIKCTSDSAFPGEKRNINLVLDGVKINSIQKLASKFKATLKFQNTLITPQNNALITLKSNDSAYIDITGNVSSDSVLYHLELIAGLGNTDFTSIDIISFKWLDENGDEIDYESETESGSFKILGICKEGGARFVNPNTKTELMQISPNPADNKLKIDVILNEEGYMDLAIYNVLGEKVKTVLSEYNRTFNKREIISDLTDLSTGQYIIILRTGTVMIEKNLSIIK